MRVNPRLRWRWEGDRLLTNTLVSLNESAGRIFEYAVQLESVEEVVEAMHREYPDADRELLSKDVAKLLENMRLWKFLVNEGAPVLPLNPKYITHIKEHFNNRLSSPLGVSCEITRRCNASCVDCFSKDSSPDPVEMGTDAWKALIKESKDANIFNFSFLGGEPLLRDDIGELVQNTSENHLLPSIHTNGYDLTAATVKQLASRGLWAVRLTLDGCTPETQDTFRGLEGLYDRVIDAIDLLQQHGVVVQVGSTLAQETYREIPTVMRMVADMGVSTIVLNRIYSVGPGIYNKDLALRPEQYLEILPEIFKVASNLNIGIQYPDIPAIYFEKTIGLDVYQKLQKRGQIEICSAGVFACNVGPRGDVTPCDVSVGVSLGNVQEQPLLEIWKTSPIFEHLRSVTKALQEPCSSCRLHTVCTSGCNALPTQIGPEGNLYSADPLCYQCFDTFRDELGGS